MRITNNSQCTHEFFYQKSGTEYTFGTSCDFSGNNFYSYATKIAMLVNDKDNSSKQYLLISWSSMTSTTGRHLSYLRSANPYYEVLEVPFSYGVSCTSVNTIINNLKDNINYYKEKTEAFSLKANREDFIRSVKALKFIYEHIAEASEADKDYLLDINPLYATVTQEQSLKELKRQIRSKQREANKEKLAKIAALKKEYTSKYDYMQLICLAYNPIFSGIIDYEAKSFIKEHILNKKGDLSFVWFANDDAKTSKNITVSRKEAEAFVKLWAKGKLKMGMKIDRYTVLEVKEDYVKIGCHKIPVQNIQALLEVIKFCENKAA